MWLSVLRAFVTLHRERWGENLLQKTLTYREESPPSLPVSKYLTARSLSGGRSIWESSSTAVHEEKTDYSTILGRPCGLKNREQTGWLGGMPAERAAGRNIRSESREACSIDLEKAAFPIIRPALISTTMLQKGVCNGIKMG